jgi:hypothetical protein
MSDFEDRLNALLSSPESMAQVAELAKKLSGSQEPKASPQPPDQPRPPEGGGEKTPDLSSILGGVDPGVLSALSSLFSAPKPPEDGAAPAQSGGLFDAKTISKFLPILAKLNDGRQDDRARLLYALRPFLRPERQNKIDRALQLAKLLSAGKLFLKGLGETERR